MHESQVYFLKKHFFLLTDSLIYEIGSSNLYQGVKKREELFDFSDYLPDHFIHSSINKKVVEKFKDELKGKIIYQFILFKLKVYSF